MCGSRDAFTHKRLMVLGILALAVVPGMVRGAPQAKKEFKLATELRKRGYTELAADQLGRILRMDFFSDSVRNRARLRLARLRRDLGQRADAQGDNQGKRDFYRKAVEDYTKYLDAVKNSAGKEQLNLVRLERGRLQKELGADRLTRYRLSVEESEKKKYHREARKWLQKAEKGLEPAAKFLLKLKDALAATARSERDRARFQKVREAAGKSLLYRAQARYQLARTYDEGSEKRNKKLKQAIEGFTRLEKEFSMFNARYVGRRYIGLCYDQMGNHEKAIKHLKSALQAESLPSTVALLRRTRLDLARAYRRAGQPDNAVVAAQVLVNSLQEDLNQDGGSGARETYFAAQVEMGRALIARAKKRLKAGGRKAGAVRDYQRAVDMVNQVSSNTRTRWSRNAKVLVDKWVEQSRKLLPEPIELKPTIHTYMAEGWSAWEAKEYQECIEAFRKAIREGDPEVHGNRVLPVAWSKMGEAYYRLSGERSGYNYYYEASLCFERVVDAYPDAEGDLPVVAARMMKDFRAALFEKSQKADRNTRYDGRRYFRALRLLSSRFPHHPVGMRARFQSAELAQKLEMYDRAARTYSSVKQDEPGYYEARYKAGLCHYLAALKRFESDEKPPPDVLRKRLKRAVALYEDYVEWYENSRNLLSPDTLEEATRWAARAELSLAKLWVHDVWGHSFDVEKGAEKTLELLSGFKETYIRGQDELASEFLPESYVARIRAYRRLEQLEKAEEFVQTIVDRYSENRLSSEAARLLGYAYLRRREKLAESGAPSHRVKSAAQKAGTYLRKALDLNPDQSLEVYLDVAGELLAAEEYEQTAKILKSGLDRFPVEGRPTKTQLQALSSLESAYLEMEQWGRVAEYARRLTKIQPNNVDFWMDLGLAYEKQERWDDAVKSWRTAKKTAGGAEDAAFRSTLHLARCYAGQGNPQHGFKVVSWELISGQRWLKDTEKAQKVLELFQKHLPDDKMKKLGEYTLQLVQQNVNLLRRPETSEFVEKLMTRHISDSRDLSSQLEKLQEQARVEEEGAG